MSNFADRALANIAADLAINPELRAAGWILPHGVFPEDYGFTEGLVLEEYYKLLENRKKQQQQQKGQGKGKPPPGGQKQQGDGQGDGGQQGGGPPDKNDPASGKGKQKGGQQPSPGKQPGGSSGQQEGQDQQANGQGGQGQSQGQGQQPGNGSGGSGGSQLPDGRTPGIGSGQCGGCTGNPSPFEQKLNEEHGRSTVDQKRIVKQTLEDIKQHAAQHGRGSVPGGLLQAIDMIDQKSEVAWQRKFAHWLKKCFGIIESGGMDYSLARPSKRSYSRGFPRPGMVQYQPEIAFILDTSGSMGTQQIKDALTEGIAIMKALGIEYVWFLQADTSVAKPAARIRLKDLMGQVQIHGRGGTDFNAALRAVEKLKPKPDLVVYLTDGDGHVTHRPKGMEVVWCIVKNHWNQKPPCDWGHVVIIADEAKMNVRFPRTG